MKKILLSTVTKIIVLLLCAVSAAAFVNYGIYVMGEYVNDEERNVANAIHELAYTVTEDSYESPEDGQGVIYPFSNVINVERTAKEYDEILNYYISVPSLNVLITNEEELDRDGFMKSKYLLMLKRENGVSSYINNVSGVSLPVNKELCGTEDYEIYISENESYTHGVSAEDILKRNINGFTVWGAFLLLGIVYLMATAGRKYGTDEIYLYRIDKAKPELLVLCIFNILLSMVTYAGFTMSKVGYAESIDYISGAAAVAFILCAICGLSIERQAKNHTLADNSLCAAVYRMGRRNWKKTLEKDYVKNAYKAIGKDKHGRLYILSTAICAFLMALSPITAVAAFLVFSWGVLNRMSDVYQIREGLDKICGGDTWHKINGCRMPEYKLIAERINEIGSGINEAVEKSVKAEKMKAELITNVSHDLKTPLTSIINYSKLLEKLKPEPAEARDYVAVIQKKSEQLKKLSAELFDISKVQSGNEKVEWERIDISLLINQTLAELNSEIENSGLKFVVNTKEELFINGDGKKLSRVFENLVVNILKYSLKGTRVFVTAEECDGKIKAEFKNISEKPLDFDAEEITERFVRGDSARSCEGNGLGLAIAKSYTELCGGKFGIVLDGDLFKAELEFNAE